MCCKEFDPEFFGRGFESLKLIGVEDGFEMTEERIWYIYLVKDKSSSAVSFIFRLRPLQAVGSRAKRVKDIDN